MKISGLGKRFRDTWGKIAFATSKHQRIRNFSIDTNSGKFFIFILLHLETFLLRNIGISAHIDSGKTTLTERILFYTGRIKEIHEVKGKDGVGAKMDSMELERERGITIKSAATYCKWKQNNINIIDTPGHVDFTVEVERSLRVLDGAVMVLCGVAGVQPQTLTVDRQMKRYKVPRLIFINKLDRQGANPEKALKDLRSKLKINAAHIQIPIGLESHHVGVVDLVRKVAYVNEGENGENIKKIPVPDELRSTMEKKRVEMIEYLADADETIADKFLNDEEISETELVAGIRRATIGLKFAPVLMGAAYKNKGVQSLLDAVGAYLPSPLEKEYDYLDMNDNEKKVPMSLDPAAPLISLAFKLEESKFGQLTYLRIYQGTLKRGDWIKNTANGKRTKVSRLVRMHSDEMEEVEFVGQGEICAIFGIECASGDTFCSPNDAKFSPTMMSMHVPTPVISLAVKPKATSSKLEGFSKALSRFQREDPTFKVSTDPETKEVIISGMGELHLDVYLERMKREYGVETTSGAPQVAYRETINKKVEFNYTHKKQSGGSGQFARVIGYMEPLTPELIEEYKMRRPDLAKQAEVKYIFDNKIVGATISAEFILATDKGFQEVFQEGPLVGFPVEGVLVVLTDAAEHQVDSNELSFKLAARGAFRDSFPKGDPVILEPIMSVEVDAPEEYQSVVASTLNQRRGSIYETLVLNGYASIKALVPLAEMFGYSTQIRSATQAKGEYSMEYKEHRQAPRADQKRLSEEYANTRALKQAAKK